MTPMRHDTSWNEKPAARRCALLIRACFGAVWIVMVIYFGVLFGAEIANSRGPCDVRGMTHENVFVFVQICVDSQDIHRHIANIHTFRRGEGSALVDWCAMVGHE